MCGMVWCCDVVQCQVWNVVIRRGMVAWGMWWCADARCEIWLWNTEWCGMVWRQIRHGVMRNDGWNTVLNVLWDSAVCNLYLNVVMSIVVRGGMWAWCGMVCWDVVEWFDVLWCDVKCDVYVKCGAMWNVAISDMVWCGMRLKCKMCDVEYGVMWTVVSWYVECYIMQDVEMWWWGIVLMKNVVYAVCCAIVVWCQMWKMMQCVVMSDVMQNQD